MHRQDIKLRDLRVEISAKEMRAKELLYNIKKAKSYMMFVLSFLLPFLCGMVVAVNSNSWKIILFIAYVLSPCLFYISTDKLIIKKEMEYDEIQEQIKKFNKKKDNLEMKAEEIKYHSTYKALPITKSKMKTRKKNIPVYKCKKRKRTYI